MREAAMAERAAVRHAEMETDDVEVRHDRCDHARHEQPPADDFAPCTQAERERHRGVREDRRHFRLQPCRLKYCTSLSCFSAAARVLNVPRLRRLPVFGLTLREYKRYSPVLSLRIIARSP